eukprot:scaffold385743_cov43-Prasinocladus_malaysianus.AAC.1
MQQGNHCKRKFKTLARSSKFAGKLLSPGAHRYPFVEEIHWRWQIQTKPWPKNYRRPRASTP